MNRPRTLLALLAATLFALAPAATARPNPADPSSSQGKGRVVILGFDGADARTVTELMAKDPAR